MSKYKTTSFLLDNIDVPIYGDDNGMLITGDENFVAITLTKSSLVKLLEIIKSNKDSFAKDLYNVIIAYIINDYNK